MADEKKTYLVNVESNLKKYADEAAEAKKKVDELTEANKALKESGKENTAEYQANAAELKNAQKEYKNLQKVVQDQLTLLNKESTYRDKLVASKTIEIQKLKELGSGYIKNAQGLDVINPKYLESKKRIGDINKAIQENDRSMNDGRTSVGLYGEAISQAFASAGKSILSMVSPLALVTAAIALGKKVFEGIKEAIMSTTFAIDIFNQAGAITKQLYYDLAIGGGIFIENLKEASKIQGELNELRIRDGFELVKLSKINREEQAVRELSIDRTKTHAERLEYLNKVIDLESQKTKIKVDNLKDELIAKEKLLKIQPANEKLALDILAIYAKINDAYAEEDASMRRINTQRTAFVQEEIDARKKLFDNYYKEIEDTNKKADDAFAQEVKDRIALRIAEAGADTEAMKKALEYKYEQEVKYGNLTKTQKLLLRAQTDNLISDLDQEVVKKSQVALQKEIDDYKDAQDKKKEAAIEYAEWDKERKLIDGENKLAILELQNTYEFELQRQALKLQYDLEVANAEKTGADITLINQKYSLAKKKIDELELKSKLSAYASFAGNIATIFGKNTAIGRAAAVAQTTIATLQSAIEAFKAMSGIPYVGPALGAVAAAAALASGYATVKEILNTKSGLPGDTGGGSAPSMPTAITSTPAAQRTYATPTGSTVLTQPQLSQEQLNTLPNQNLLTAADIAKALESMPRPVVTVEDINARQAAVNKVSVRANI